MPMMLSVKIDTIVAKSICIRPPVPIYASALRWLAVIVALQTVLRRLLSPSQPPPSFITEYPPVCLGTYRFTYFVVVVSPIQLTLFNYSHNSGRMLFSKLWSIVVTFYVALRPSFILLKQNWLYIFLLSNDLEARQHGAGFYAFDRDEQKRAEQMEELERIRAQTESARNQSAALTYQKQVAMNKRLLKIRQKKRMKMGLAPLGKHFSILFRACNFFLNVELYI